MKKSIATVLTLFVTTLFVNAQKVIKVGDTLSNIQLQSTKGDVYSLNNHKTKGYIIIFMTPSCDHCLAYVGRASSLNLKYQSKGFPVVAIGPYGDNENDYPYDAMPAMKKLAEEKAFTFPYLADEKFKYTWLFDINQTPKAVVLKKLKQGYIVTYIGNIDDEPNEKKVPKKKYVELAVNKLLIENVH